MGFNGCFKGVSEETVEALMSTPALELPLTDSVVSATDGAIFDKLRFLPQDAISVFLFTIRIFQTQSQILKLSL